MPALIRPMLASPGELPPAAEDAGWAYELKWDGVRAVGYVTSGALKLFSRNDIEITAGYPEVAGLGRGLGMDAVLDGEIVAFDERGRTNFGLLQERMHVRDAAAVRRLTARVPVVYLVFDVLSLDGESLLDVPLSDRRALLERLAPAGPAWQAPPSFDGPGADVLAASLEQGMEGVVAKRRDSRYRPGRRSPDWRKVKHIRMQDVVVVGWRPGSGRRDGRIGALLVAVNGPAGLVYAGRVGTGFTDRMLVDLAARLAPLARDGCPLAVAPPRAETRDARWVTPLLVGKVVFTEWTSDHRIRHPSWRGLRADRSPSDVLRVPGRGA
jgi:bifunctional non-homologous end joining protein LigD